MAYHGNSPRIITRLDNACYEFLRYDIGFNNIDEFINSLVKTHMESRGNIENKKQ